MAPSYEKSDNARKGVDMAEHEILNLRYRAIRLMLAGIAASGLDRTLAPRFGGRGVILTLHHVRPDSPARFPENAGLGITPAFLDRALGLLRARGYDLVPLAEVPARLADPGARSFAALTFDDGYRDTLDCALPVLRAHRAPFTLFVCPGFAERTAPLWWLDLEEAVMRLALIRLETPLGLIEAPARNLAEKYAAFRAVYWRLRALPEKELRAAVAALCRQAGIDQLARTARLCLDWEGLKTIRDEPLASIGAHSLSHPRLAMLDTLDALEEIEGSRTRIAVELGVITRDFAYPVGDPASAGQREFDFVNGAGYRLAVTTRPGVLHAAHRETPSALPRISLNGLFQREDYLSALISGVPFAFSR